MALGQVHCDGEPWRGQPPEPFLFPKLRNFFADFPQLL